MPADDVREAAARVLAADPAGALGYGVGTGALETTLDAGVRPSFIHTIPNFHNPAGCTLSLQKRQRMLELAAEHDFLIFEDDPYAELRFEGADLPRMLELDTSDRVVYAC